MTLGAFTMCAWCLTRQRFARADESKVLRKCLRDTVCGIQKADDLVALFEYAGDAELRQSAWNDHRERILCGMEVQCGTVARNTLLDAHADSRDFFIVDPQSRMFALPLWMQVKSVEVGDDRVGQTSHKV